VSIKTTGHVGKSKIRLARDGSTSTMLITVAVVIFIVGLVSEQVAQLRFNRNDSFREK